MLFYVAIAFCFIVSCSKPSAATCGSSSGGPKDDPVAALYGNLTYSWANSIVNWSCVYNVKDYHGSFEDAQKAASSAGGGVVYFPSGTYNFKSNIMIESNIVIRGEPTTEPAKKEKSPGPLSPKTVFKCTFGQHLGVFNNDPKATNLGIVNIEMDGCAVMLWPALKTVSGPVNLKTYIFEATDVIGMGQNKIVLGNKIHDVTYEHPDPTNTTDNIWPWRFGTALACYSDMNALIANNLISKSATSKKVTVTFSGDKMTVPYPVDNRYGIDVNQVLLGAAVNSYYGHKCPSQPGTLTPSCAPWFFRQGLVIRDNYVYMNGRVGVSWSGGGDGKTVGSGTQIYNNHVEVAAGTTCWSVTGIHKATGHDTNENRGYNQGGYANNLTMNTGHINRQKAADSNYMTVDGEGILHQASTGNDGIRNLWYKNDLSGGSTGYLVYYKLFNVIDNQLIVSHIMYNGQYIYLILI